MARPGGDDREAVDRAFADLIAGYHLTAERPEHPVGPVDPEPQPGGPLTASGGLSRPGEPDAADPQWIDSVFRFSEPPPAPQAPEPEERFVPEPPTPLSRPAWPVLVAWLGMGYAVLAVLATTLGAHLPAWAGWLALVGFVAGFALLITRLPRHRPPDAGDGAVL